jgi:site-specific DNA recombinase
MDGVIYARYSSDNQREGQECQESTDIQGITIFGTYIDRAYSAKTDNRPEFQRMIKDSAQASV